jgi:ElaA protein
VHKVDEQVILKRFDELTMRELYALLKLRQDVFIVEQACAFPDIDGKDPIAMHLLMYLDNELVGYTRLFDMGQSYADALAIGRVVVAPKARGTGMSYTLMKHSIVRAFQCFGKNDIKIGAQAHLAKMYGKLGFVQSSDEYDEDGIAHIEMLYKV